VAEVTPDQVRGGLRFAGYAAVFDAPDRGGDIVRRGAFGAVGAVPLLWQHRGEPVGAIEHIEEDTRGLRVIGRVADAELAQLVAGGAIGGLSVGYCAIEVRQGARRELRRVALVEVSLVAQPMQPLARIHALESFNQGDE
jgi:HK97 family phage prohead protease